MKKIAVLGANEPSLHFYRQAKKLGYCIVGIAWKEGAVCEPYCDAFYPVSFSEREKVLDICRKEKIDGITSFSLESALPTLIYVAQNIGLVSNTYECLNRLSNKFTMRRCLEINNIPNPRYVAVKSLNEMATLSIPFPVIVKPVDSGGSQGVTKIESVSEMEDAFSRAVEYSGSGSVIVEQYIDGREFSVEYLSCNGVHYNLQITDKVTSGAPYFVELQHHQPADISDDLSLRIKRMVESALTALKVENSPSHTEIKLNNNNELFIIEVGARLGGDFITSDLVRLSTGYDLVKGALELCSGDFVPPVKCEKPCFSGVYFYSSLTPSIRKYIDNQHEYPQIVMAYRDKNNTPYCYRNGDRNGYFIYQSDSKYTID